MEIFLFWIVLAIFVGVLAARRGRSGAGWFFLSALLISPLLGLIFVICLPNLLKQAEEQRRHEELLAAMRGLPPPVPPQSSRPPRPSQPWGWTGARKSPLDLS